MEKSIVFNDFEFVDDEVSDDETSDDDISVEEEETSDDDIIHEDLSLDININKNIIRLNNVKYELNQDISIYGRQGLYVIIERYDKKSNAIVPIIHTIGNYIKPIKYIIDMVNGNKIELEYTNDVNISFQKKVQLRDIVVRNAMLKEFGNMGYCPLRKNAIYLQDYLIGMLPKTTPHYAVYRTGWFANNQVFVLPADVRICSKENEDKLANTTYEGYIRMTDDMLQRGTVAEWRENVANLCIGRIYAEFALLFAFTSVFASRLNSICMLHYYTETSKGKTSITSILSSIFGEHISRGTWNGTINGLPSFVIERQDVLSILDEAHRYGQADQNFDEMAYDLLCPETKIRMETWNIKHNTQSIQGFIMKFPRIFSNGERGLSLSASGGKQARIINIGVCDAFKDANLTRAARNASKKYYGTVGIEYIRYIIENNIDIESRYLKHIDDLSIIYKCNNVQMRMLEYFAEMLLAGEILKESGILDFDYRKTTLEIFEHHVYNLFKYTPTELGVLDILYKYIVKGKPYFIDVSSDYKGYNTIYGYTEVFPDNSLKRYLRLRAFLNYLKENNIILRVDNFENLLRDAGILIGNEVIKANEAVYEILLEPLFDIMDNIELYRSSL